MRRGLTWAWIGLSLACLPAVGDEMPVASAPLEYLVGGWKGTAIPQANRLKGWSETHNWAWKFDKGTPVATTVTLDGDKVIKKATLTYDDASKSYRLEGTDSADKAVAFKGKLDTSGKVYPRLAEGMRDKVKERITLRPINSKIRYTMTIDRQEPGAPQFSKYIEVGLTKEGEAFASGGAAATLSTYLPDGPATMADSPQGQAHPHGRNGRRDESRPTARSTSPRPSSRPRPRTSRPPPREEVSTAFDGLVDDPPAKRTRSAIGS